MNPCHECGLPAEDTCVRCQRPTCPLSFHDQHYLGICQCCFTEMTVSGLPLVEWRWPLRRPLPEG